MRVVFAGPSLYGLDVDWGDVVARPPAALGDIAGAVDDGAQVIGLADGYFGWTPSVWHKEILYALSHGVTVYGAASLGALRAAECAAFGMRPVGRIAHWYLDGTLDDDGDVALVHYPAEAGFAPMTEPLVDVRASLDRLAREATLDAETLEQIRMAAQALNFRERSLEAMIARAVGVERLAAVMAIYEQGRVSLKGEDALALVDAVKADPLGAPAASDWVMEQSFPWRGLVATR